MTSLQEPFICAICQEFGSDITPNWFVTTPNGHVFHFRGCLKKWIDNGAPRCPLCNETITRDNLTRLYAIDPVAMLIDGNVRNITCLTGGTSMPRSTGKSRLHMNNSSEASITASRTPDYNFHIILLGDSTVGKSSLLQRYTQGVFNFTITSTLGSDVVFKKIAIGNKVIQMNLWDTSGQETFKAITKNFVRNAHGVILTYGYGPKETNSLASIQEWMNFIDKCGTPGVGVMLVGNKADIPETHRSITTEQGQQLARMLRLPFFETSALDNYNVDAIFRALAVDIMQRVTAKQLEYRNPKQDRGIRLRQQKKSKPKEESGCAC